MVTGGGGFIAGHLVRALLERGDEVRAVDIRPIGEWKQAHQEARNWPRMDLSEPGNARQAAKGQEVIFHLAADSGGMGYISYHHADCMTNILADVQMARAAQEEGARIYYASSSCFPAGTPIWTSEGLRPIESLGAGDKVLTHQGRWRAVTEVMKRSYTGPMQRVHGPRGQLLECTPDHRLLTNKGWAEAQSLDAAHVPVPAQVPFADQGELDISMHLSDGDRARLAFRESGQGLAEFVKGHYGVTRASDPRRYSMLTQQVLRWRETAAPRRIYDAVQVTSVKLDRDFGELCGLFAAEGWTERQHDGPRRGIGLAFDDDEPAAGRFTALLGSVLGVAPVRVSRYAVNGTYRGQKLGVTSKALYAWFSELFYQPGQAEKRAWTKTVNIPPELWTREFTEGFLAGYHAGDGNTYEHASGRRRESYYTTSPWLAHTLMLMLRSLGKGAAVAVQDRGDEDGMGTILGRAVRLRRSYTVYLVKSTGADTKRRMSTGALRYLWSEPSPLLASTTVYNLEVDEDHSYVAGDFVVHNCTYPLHIQVSPDTPPIREEDLLSNSFNPELGYGWEKLYAEMVYQAYAADKGLDARIGRFYSVYGSHGWYKGGREKAPTALCRKVATAKLTGAKSIEVWGDGTARRTFTYVDDAVDAVLAIAGSSVTEPLNVGGPKTSSISELVAIIEDIAGYQVARDYIDGPVGVGGRPSDDTKIRSMTGWKQQVSFREGMERTYRWTYDQVRAELGR
jgi:nucleoside-diphosphate-sugar epimerase